MKVIDQSHEILHMDGLERIERAARTCYKSEDRIGCSAEDRDDCANIMPAAWECEMCENHSSHKLVYQLIKRGHEAMLEHGSATVKFITNRGVTHELVRHRVASFGQESTRYVNYGGKEIEFIQPVWLPSLTGINGTVFEENYVPCGTQEPVWEWLRNMLAAENAYKKLLAMGQRPEQAREVLPNSLKTEIVATANYREWRHIFRLRAIGTTGKPHPQMQALMVPVLEEFKKRVPSLFHDLEPKE